jgi:class 3 adenylate cyclase
VICFECGAGNGPDSSFCTQCGASLGAVCAACATGNAADARFCRRCGAALRGRLSPGHHAPSEIAQKILASARAIEGERKHLTVLFVDVTNSMQLAAALGPEGWAELTDGLFRILAEGVYRFEGTVNQYTGDGALALFGAPIAHEDHAQRACHAARHLALRLREYAERLRAERGVELAVRMGINSGEVVFGKIGDDLHIEYTAQGHTVGLAARMGRSRGRGASA